MGYGELWRMGGTTSEFVVLSLFTSWHLIEPHKENTRHSNLSSWLSESLSRW
jgi:hypothetical protein